ncbi:uncharacterized mitochondrial protein AtMg00810-like [Dioscorea cayenensis subsp. rotundata]|uniref:Uncharacterized mitochondrial protein AtMg00810-like n=1 Tax=Dioscorea cayennensis subsp. rotundata TaxID=55577 RepID=A0AB40C329_DIOCR|nr:uncharacterized mitochondrial protein AtMg00810-like [Dioscorea cayenensis subsp. rotundata]
MSTSLHKVLAEASVNLHCIKGLEKGSEMLFVCLYVDDIIYMGASAQQTEIFKLHMIDQFEITDLRILHYFLGLEIHQSSEGITISQTKYAGDLLHKFGMEGCKHLATHMNANKKLKLTDGTIEGDAVKYRSMVGELLYLTHTHPNLIYAISLVSRFMCQPTMQHPGAVKRILCYAAGIQTLGIHYTHAHEFNLVGYTDSD